MMDVKEMLELKFYCSDLSREVTVRGFMQELLLTLFVEKDGFSGKRPFGNSCWDYKLIYCLCRNGLLKTAVCNTDPDYPEEEDWCFDDDEAETLIENIIKAM